MTEQSVQTRTRVRIPGQRVRPVSSSQVGSAVAGAPAPTDRWERLSWPAVARVVSARVVLGAVLGLLLWALLPIVIGWTPRVILSGSMEPRIHTGDVVVTRTVDAAAIDSGMVVTTDDPDRAGVTRTHRVVERDAAGLIVTKGDANAGADSSPVGAEAVHGVGVIRVPYIGLPGYWLATRDGLALGLGTVALAGLVLASWVPGPASGGGTPRRTAGTRPRRTRRRQLVVTGVVATTVLGALLASATAGRGSYAAFAATSTNAGSSFAAAPLFDPVAAAGYAAVVQGDQPTLHWRLDESVGDVAADAVGSRSGAVSNARWGRAGALRSEVSSPALELDGGSVTQQSSYAIPTAWSVEIWVRTTRTSGGPLLTAFSSGGALQRSLYLGQDGRLRFGSGSGAALVAGSASITDGAWHHVVLTSASSGSAQPRARLYLDGRLHATGRTLTGGLQGYWRAAHAQWSSNLEGNPDQFLRGHLDEVAVYPDVLTEAEVAEHHSAAGY